MNDLTLISDVLEAERSALASIAQRVTKEDRAHWIGALDLLERCEGHLVVSGMGKSGLIGAKISATFSSLGLPSSVLHPSEAMHGDLGRVRRGDVVMLLSYSGETEEVVNLAALLRQDGVPRLGISCSHTSSLAALSDVHLSLGEVTEACPLQLAPTASTTAALAIADALALGLAQRRSFGADDFQKRHPGGLLGVGLRPITEALRYRVGENLAVVPDNVSVREAMQRASAASARRAGAVVLVDADGVLSGIFTDADLRRLIVRDTSGMDCPIAEVMTRRPEHMTTDHLVRDAVRLVRENQHDEIPVLDGDGRPIGLLDVQDLIAMKVVSES
ncbi:MAG: KpsF/GutQ family sugar-phosphate isomerase [Planctomycetota bacterium]|jgi:arabinose-5-phosphate isomerase